MAYEWRLERLCLWLFSFFDLAAFVERHCARRQGGTRGCARHKDFVSVLFAGKHRNMPLSLRRLTPDHTGRVSTRHQGGGEPAGRPGCRA